MIGRIYKIESNLDDGKFYIGSTTQSLAMRLKNHRSKSKDPLRQKTPLYQHFNMVGWEHASISLLYAIEDATKEAILDHEKEYIQVSLSDDKCLNKATPQLTEEEKKEKDRQYGAKWRQENKERAAERIRKWRAENPEKWKAQTARYRAKAKETS